MQRWWMLLPMFGCWGAERPPPSEVATVAGPVAEVALDGDWVILEEDSSTLVLRLGKTAHGVRITTANNQERAVGVAPIVHGRTMEVEQSGRRIPMFAWPWPEHPLSAVRLEVQGPDLLIQLSGPPIDKLTAHPDAPTDPALSWVRIRPRGDTWRLALRGVHRWTLPGTVGVEHRGDERSLRSSWGRFDLTTDAVRLTSTSGPTAWTWDSKAGLDEARPYPKTGVTWTLNP